MEFVSALSNEVRCMLTYYDYTDANNDLLERDIHGMHYKPDSYGPFTVYCVPTLNGAFIPKFFNDQLCQNSYHYFTGRENED